MKTYHVAVHSHVAHACCKEYLELTPFLSFFRHERDAVSRFFESPESQGKDTLLYSITNNRVVGWVSVVRFYYFLTNLRASNVYKTAFVEGWKLALVKEPFCVPLLKTADELSCFLSVSCDLCITEFCMD